MKFLKNILYNYFLSLATKSSKVRHLIYNLYHQLNLQGIEQQAQLTNENLYLERLKKQVLFSDADYAFLRKKDPQLLWELIRARDEKFIEKISPERTVLNGPFEGLRFPAMNIREINLASKIAGSYESELHAVVESICHTPYQQIIDVGCAEGYYAVGFARRVPSATLYAFDIDDYSRSVCKAMAVLNQVEERVVLDTACTPDVLKKFPTAGRTLIMSDCEGYELELFDTDVIAHLKTCDFLIELHDCIIPGITSTLLSRFANTHKIHIIRTTDEPDKHYDKLDSLTPDEQKAVLFTHRGNIGEKIFMEWAWLQAYEHPQ